MILLAVVVATGCSSTRHNSAVETTVRISALTAPPALADLDDGCHPASSTTVPPDAFGSVHTIPPRTDPVTYELAVTPSTVCPGGSVRIAIRVTNRSSKQVTVSPDLIITWPGEHLECCDAVTVPAHSDTTVVETVTIPTYVTLGPKSISLRDFSSDDPTADKAAQLTVVAAAGAQRSRLTRPADSSASICPSLTTVPSSACFSISPTR